ncbi:non-ribosomal peptide synthase/polyketide synthase [Gordonia sp. PP30]|uniref:non-ribosomal peptide synthase/polyketide synthase n=1 Tax=Gordonia sp. PP30 TaxID=2935861 RepID=UPI001FFE7EF8|nr:non-ribosomal peptide synthase/polyketide synthase [Gordonia sp. PP30]UQE74423.1 non-ribosomal peptide synthase/polyketide synthase [Gordonia sp. PP30]
MTLPTPTGLEFARLWGGSPAVVDQIAFVAAVDPDRIAIDREGSPVTFASLHAQVSATAGVLAAQGLDAGIAVNAAITGALPVTELSPDEIAARSAAVLSGIAAAVYDAAGSEDLASMPGIFRGVARRQPDRVAVSDLDGGSLTYRELDERSDTLAAGLIAAGAGPETRVGVALPRTVDLIVALVATLKTGAAYLPLDTSHPVDRLRSIIDDAAPVLILTDPAGRELWAGTGFPLMTVDEAADGATEPARSMIPRAVDPRHAAYVMYTSGSTGRPKGVVVTHADLVALLAALANEYDYSPDDVWSMFQSYGFDLSVGEIWPALAFGGRLVVLDYLTTRAPDEFVKVLERERISVVNLTPSAFYQLAAAVREPAPGRLSPSVRSMIFVGEALDFAQVRRWFDDRERYDGNDGPQLNNMYGPTEATVYLTRRELTREFVRETLASDVGTALLTSRVYVLDARLKQVPDGVPGDLYLAGDQLARGYDGRFDLTSTRFVADPFGEPGDRMYQSGDVAIIRGGGLEFLGRADDQVKVRGYRIELGEVEAALESADGVNAAAAAVKQRDGFPEQLVGYVVGTMPDGGSLDAAKVREAASSKVPDYMVPDVVMVLDRLPLNVSGKLDRRALPKPVVASQAEFVAPANRVEQQLAGIVGEMLGLDLVSVTQSVFELGGNSLLAAKIVGRACEVLGVYVNMRDIFAAPTVRGLAAKVSDLGAALPALTAPDARPDLLPLSLAQERMWFINRFDPDDPAYNIPMTLRIGGDLDLDVLRAAVGDVVARHEVLRTVFADVDGVAVQLISPVTDIPAKLDWRILDSAEQFAGAAAEGFDVTTSWPIRVLVWQSAPGEHLLGLIAHHIGADGESLLPLVADLVTAYTARRGGEIPSFSPLAIQFADFALWQRTALGSPDDAASVLGAQLAYWRGRLAGLPDVLELPADHPRPARASHRGEQIDFGISAAVAGRLTALARELDATPFMVLHAALAVLLARLSATDDIAVATPTAGRGQEVLEPLVGMFVNTLVLRAHVDPAASFRTLVERIRTDDLDAYANADIPFEALVQALDPVRSEAFSPLAQVMLSLDPAASAAAAGLEVAGLSIVPAPAPVVPAQVDLTVTIASAAESEAWSGTIIYATDLYEPASAERFAERFVRLLGELTAHPDTPVGDEPLVLDAEAARVLAASAGPVVDVPAGRLADVVAACCARTPSAPAVVFEDRIVSYGEFGARVAALARELISVGVGPDVAVGVCLEPSVELVLAVHAISAAGGQYVPVGMDAPRERAVGMLAAAGASLVLVAAGDVPAPLAGVAGVRLHEVDSSAEVDRAAGPVTDRERLAPVQGDTALYTLFTSGSTGVPKGVTVAHDAVVNRLEWMRRDYGIDAGDRFLLKTPYTFDVSVWELYLPFTVGARLVVARPGGHRDPEYLAATLTRESVSLVHFVPSMLSVFVDVLGGRLGELTSLRAVFTSGEALTPTVAQALLSALPGVELHNLYGPTEAAVDVTAARVLPGEVEVPIGRPVANTLALVLDPRLCLVPDGVPGELYLGGVQLARGYAGRPDLSAERFVADPFGGSGARLYRTGDLVRRRADGSLLYLGRTDFQVKLRGQRIELGEIEAVIAATPGVVHAAAVVAEAPAGGQVLVGYVAPASADLDAVKASVSAALPEYMVPTIWMRLDEVVLSSAGKLDRRALPEPDFEIVAADYVPPVGPIEEQLAAIVAGLLDIDRVSVTESFFALGGDSILSIRLASAARAAGWELSPKDIFESRSVRRMAALAADLNRGVPLLEELPGGGAGASVIRPAVSWMLESSDGPRDFADFSQSAILVAPEGLTESVLGELLAAVVAVHPMLSARLRDRDGDWSLDAGTGFDPADSVAAVTSPHPVDSNGYAADLRAAFHAASRRLDPAAGRLVQAVLVSADGEGARIVLVIHHLGVDTVSWPVIVEDLITAWSQRQSGAEVALRPEVTSQRTWAAAIAEHAKGFDDQTGYWLARLPERTTSLGAEFDRARDRERTATSVVHHLTPEITDAVLTSLPQAFGGNINDVLLGTLARAIRSWQRARGIVDDEQIGVLVEGHGRDEPILETGAEPVRADLSRTVGWFTTLIPMMLDPADDVVHAIKAAKEERLGVPDRGAGFGELRYRAGGALAERPMPSILFNYLGAVGDSRAGAGLAFSPVGEALELPGSPNGDMAMPAALVVDTVAITEGDGRRLRTRFRFPEALLTSADVTDLGERWSAELAEAAAATSGEIGLSPSDVPGSGVTQSELDRLAGELPGADVWPLTPLQLGLYFQSVFAGPDEVDAYHIQVRISFAGEVDEARLRAAMTALVGHHRVLRSGFRQIDAGVVAVVPPEVPVALRVVALDGLDAAAVATRVAEIADAERLERFDLAAPPLMRAALVTHDGGADLVVTSHHLLFDGWSGPLVMADLLALYATGSPYTPTHEKGFADHVRAVAGSADPVGLDAWRSVLHAVEGPTRIASAGATTVDAMPEDFAFTLDRAEVSAIHRLARDTGVTLATVLQAAWAVLLARVTGNRVVSFGETVSGRPADLDGVDTMVGLFINTLPVVVDADPGRSFRDLLGALQSDKVRVLDHQSVGLPALAAIAPAALEFDTLVLHESYPIDAESISAARPGGLELRDIEMRDATHYPVTFVSAERDGQLIANLKHFPGAFGTEQIEIFADGLREVLRAAARAPETLVGDLPLTDDSARQQLVTASTGRIVEGLDESLSGAVAAQVARTPEAVALVFGEREVTYREFGLRVAALARRLAAAGVRAETAVAVAVPRSVEVMVAVHAVVAAGGQYVPIDLDTPVDRVEYMLRTAGVRILIVSDRAAAGAACAAADTVGIAFVDVDASMPVDADAVWPTAGGAGEVSVASEAAVYTLFTSGSTGMPKGVTLSQGAVVNRLRWGLDELPIGAADVVVQKTPYTFDCSVPELFAPLMVGAKLVVLKPGGHLEPGYLAAEIARTSATMVHFVPSMLSVFLDVVPAETLETLRSVRIVSTTGEALPPAVAAPAREVWPDALFYNLYGPTEAAVEITYERIERVSAGDSTVPIGVPVWNSTALVLDDRLRLVPAGIPGELYLGGVQLARGYASRADLTAERFVADPFGGPGARLYRTGDLVRRRTDGSLEYLGRTDFQVKLRGQRIELGEIEAVLAAAPGVVHAAVTVAQSPDGGEHLVGYLAAGPGQVLGLAAVQASAAAALPGYMVPTVWMVVEDITLNTAGKLDRRALPAPEFGAPTDVYEAPEGPVEERLAVVFAEVLGVDRMSATESFFDAGGNSLSAMRLVARAGEVLGTTLSVRDLFADPSVRALAAAAAGAHTALVPLIPPAPRPTDVPLSFAQERMWFINRFEPEAPTYNIPVLLRVTGDLDLGALRAALVDTVIRHEILRTVFPDVDGAAVQRISPVEGVPELLDWRVLDTYDDFAAAVGAGFDVTRVWPIRGLVLRDGPDEHLLALVVHHIAADGESMLPLVADLVRAYEARRAGDAPAFAPLEVQFADFAVWQRAALGSIDDPDSVLGAQLGYWRERLAELPEVLELPADHPRPPVASHRGARVDFEIPATVADRLTTLAREWDATPFMVVHAALDVLLARLSATDEVAIATPIAGRGQAALDPLVGMFVNTLVLRTRIASSMSFAALVEQVRAEDLDAFANADVPFEALVQALDPVRSEAFSPLAQVMLSFDPAAAAAAAGFEVAGLTLAPVPSPVVPAQVDLTFTLASAPRSRPWSGSLTYATDLFEPASAELLAGRFVRLLDELTAAPALPIGDEPLLLDGETERILAVSHGSTVALPTDTVADAVAAQVTRTPRAEALWFEGRSVSYAEFGARVAMLARRLIAAGVRPDTPVGVCLERGVELLVAVHAVTAAGGRYVPIGVDTPADRARYMLDTAGVRLVLVADGESPEPLNGADEVVLLEVDASEAVDLTVPPVTDADRLAPLRPENALYTLFTSGSTGVPKGVTVTHRSVLNRLRWGLDGFGWSVGDRVVLKTPYTFDVSVPELYGPLIGGAAVVIAREGGHREPDYLADLLAETAATSVHFVPSMLSVFLDVVDRDRLAALTSLRWLFASGEALAPSVAAAAHAVWPTTEIHNLFGPTEAAVEVSWADVSDAPEVVTIGAPVWNTSTLVLDDRLHPVPAGVPGELYLGGVQVARGYEAQAGLTAERFVADPFGAPGTRLYRTGDLVRWTVDQQIEYLGRTDFQVKLRGQRVELGEIEAAIAAAPGVVHTAATVARAAAGGEFLVAYVAPSSVDLDAVKASVAGALPDYMRPSVWMPLDAVVLNSAGKLDRRALPAADLAMPQAEYVAPEGANEAAVAEVFADLLGVARVSVTGSFFDLGGNSLSAMRVVARAGEVLGAELSVRDLFDAPSVRTLVAAAVDRSPMLAPIVRVEPRPDRVPLSFAQQRMWFINRLDPAESTYNIPSMFRLTGEIDADALRAAAADLVGRHEILRTTFPAADGRPHQVVSPVDEVRDRLDWRECSAADDLAAELRRGFDLATEWPIRVRLARTGAGETYLGVVVHHIAFDGQSFGPLASDLLASYAARVGGRAPGLEPLPVQYADYAIWQRAVLGEPGDTESVVGRELAFWRDELAGVPDVLTLPSDRPRPPVASHRGRQHVFDIPAEVAALVDAAAARYGATRFIVLHAAFAVLLARLSGAGDIVIGAPVGGRGRRELDSLIGMFVNTLALRTRVDARVPFESLLSDVRRRDIEAFDHARVPFESVVDALNPVRSEAFSPIVQVILSVDPVGAPTEPVTVGGLRAEPVEVADEPAQLDLNLTVATGEAGEAWRAVLTYATDLFEPSTIEALGARFVRVLAGALTAPETPVGDVPLVLADELPAVLAESAGSLEPVLDETIAEAVAASVARVPEAVALIAGDREVTYREFGVRVGALGHRLAAIGVGPDSAVGVVMDRSVELVIAVHAIMAAGGQYVPIAIDAPLDRARYIARTAGVGAVLTSAAEAAPDYVTALDVPVIEVDGAAELPVDVPSLTPGAGTALRSGLAAYTLFTSGSTGVPKGVTVSHRAVRNFVAWFDELVPAGDQRLLFKTPHTFDASVLELFWPPATGRTMVIADAQGHRDPRYLADVMNEAGVTVVQFVPSLLAAFLDVVGDGPLLPGLRVLFSGGEALPPAVASDFRRRVPQATVTNLFGPTEAAVYTMSAHLDRVGEVVPIGRPMRNTTALVLDDRLNLVPDGVSGELYLGGIQSARGYASRADLTAERFVADPFGEPSARMYRTGDLVRRRPDGELEYLGRTDFQVKLRGQRMELGEVEAAIAAAPGVVHAAARVVEGPAGDQLVGYVAPSSAGTDRVATELAARLPEYMVPTVWVSLDEMPLNTAGKVDRRALPEPEFTAAEYTAPVTDAEQAVAAVYADLLGADRVSVTESFFDLGGNSLAAMRLVARTSEVLGVQLSVRDVFDAPSVRALAAAVAGRAPALPPITAAAPRPERVPLSFAQQRMWFLNQLDPALPTYNIPTVLRLEGAVDLAALRAAVIDVVGRHEVLRTTFPAQDGEPAQHVSPAADVARRIDWASVRSADELRTELMRGFDVTVDWPIRVRWLPSSGPDGILGVVVHHIAFDGQSMGPFAADLMASYAARAAGDAPTIGALDVQFADYAIWQHEVLGAPDDQSSIMGRQLDFWRSTLAGVPDVLELPADRPRPVTATHRGAQLRLTIPARVAQRADAFAAAHGVTRFMVLHAAFAVLLSRLSGSDDIVIGTPTAGRGQPALDAMVGMFVNTLVLRSRIDTADDFTAIVKQVRSGDLAAFENAEVPFEAIVDALNPTRSDAFSPLVQVILSVDPTTVDPGAVEVDGLSISAAEIGEPPAQMDLNVTIVTGEEGEDWTGLLTYATDLFDEATVTSFGDRFVRVLDAMLTRPGTAVGDVALMAERERGRVLEASDGPSAAVDGETLAGALERSLARSPEAIALVAGDRELSYAEFGARVGDLARRLIAAGAGPDVAVGVVMDRSVELVIAVHAITTAGGQYVPIDPSTPADRAEYMMRTAGVGVTVVRAGGPIPDFVSALSGHVVEFDAAAHTPWGTGPLRAAQRRAPLRPADAAYTLFTSGSTGRPKGVTVSHQAVWNFLTWFDDHVPAGEQRLLFKTPHTFDASVLELFWPLVTGQTMVIAEAQGHRDLRYLAEEIDRAGVTVVQFVPSLLSAFLDVVDDDPLLPGVRVLFSGGEALLPAVAKRAAQRMPAATLVNLFGPTEAAVYTMSAELTEVGELVPIGRPMPNTSALVLDHRLHPVPDGVAGELYLGGVQSARGYAARPELTAERFVADPFGAAGARMYRTGDLVRRTADGDLEYLGRTDFQVKLRGQRLELGEVEAAIAAVPGVVLAAARVVDGPAGEQLVGYVSPAAADLTTIETALGSVLTEYMRPTAWVLLDDLPLNAAGKVDRRALPDPELGAAEYVPPASEDETVIARVFADLVGVDEVSVTESFFDLGGNSLAAMRLAARVAGALGVQISVRDVFDAPTVRALAATVSGRSPSLAPVSAAHPRPERIPLSFAQQRMWFINRFDPEAPTYNIPVAVRLRGRLDLTALRQAARDVVARHEVLRTTFPAVDGEPVQLIHAAGSASAEPDLAVVDDDAALVAAAGAGFDVAERPPMRIRLLQDGPDDWVLLTVIHHIVGDGESMGPLISDMIRAYSARAAGADPGFAELPVQFADYALWQQSELGRPEDPDSVVGRQLVHWERALAGLPDVLELPADRPRPPVATHVGAQVRVELPRELGERVEQVARERGVSPFMVVHAGLAVLLSRLSATPDIAVATPIAGRGQAELDGLVGMFVNTLILRTDVDIAATFDDLVEQVRGVDLEAFAHADVPFETVVDRLNPVRSQAFSPLAQVLLSVIHAHQRTGDVTVPGLRVTPVPPPVTPAQVDLAFHVEAHSGAPWQVSIVYATDLFEEGTVARLGQRLVAVLDGVTRHPGDPVALAPLVSDGEREEIAAWSRGSASGDTDRTLAGLIDS